MPIEQPDIQWQDGQLHSQSFDDIYFSPVDGLAESQYVFVEQSGLQALLTEQQDIVVGEIGFGTGLNFLASWHAWEQSGAQQNLHYISIEKYPLSTEDISAALQHWPVLAAYCKELTEAYPIRRSGCYRLSFAQGRIQLTLIFNDVELALSQMSATCDIWYLDGFAPQHNKAMWTDAVCKEIAAHSKNGTQLSTFTAAGFVRRALADCGFNMKKVKGFGKKREMLRGVFKTENKQPHPDPLYALPIQSNTSSKRMAIIGAGLAGSSMAYLAARAGYDVDIFDPQGVAQAASGNPVGIAGPNLSADDSPFAQFYFSAWQLAMQHFNELQEKSEEVFFKPITSQHALFNQQERKRAEKLIQAHTDIDAWAQLHEESLDIHHTALIDPGVLCRAYIKDDRIHLINDAIHNLMRVDQQWRLIGSQQYAGYDVIVCAQAQAALALDMCAALEMQSVRGQLIAVEEQHQVKLEHVQQADVYVTPVWKHQQIVGATFHRDDACSDLRQQDQDQLLDDARKNLGIGIDQTLLSGRVAFRSCGPDRMPIIGPLYDHDFFTKHYADLKHGRQKQYPIAQYIPNVFTSLAHGSRGIVGSIYAAQIIMDCMQHNPLACSIDVWKAICSQRFILRQLKRS